MNWLYSPTHRLYSPIALHMNQLYVFSPRSVDNDKIIVTHYPRAEMNVPTELAIAPLAEMGDAVLFSRACLEKLHTRIFVLKSINKKEKTHFSWKFKPLNCAVNALIFKC
mmetsp:Transcript_8969/g.25852  ORF Transcript_8969/g.25852 Transcript_8969/m.25852 type:complete len:110 (-) Transcript_8969:789-1118(-)